MPTEITERTWEHEMCKTGWQLRMASWGEISRKSAYEDHVMACPACQAYFAELREAAEKAEHPAEEAE